MRSNSTYDRTTLALALVMVGAGAALTCTLTGGCTNVLEREADASEVALPVPPGTLRLGTYNAGLAPGDVEYADERAPELASAIGDLALDVLCLQEIWRQDDWTAIAATVKARFPHAVRLAPDAECAMCSPVELDPLAACAQASCAEFIDGDLVTCALSECGAEVAPLGGGCAGCLVGAATGGRVFREVRDACAGGGMQGAPSYLYACGHDTGILSALEIEQSASLVLDSYLVRAAVDHARVATELGPVDVFCTHLASNIAEFEYRGEFADWKGEQRRQIDQLLAFVEAKADPKGITVVLGDLNNGPGVEAADIDPQWEDHYQRVLEAGFANPYAAQDDVACTSCPDNSLHGSGTAKLIDHVLVRGFEGPWHAARFLTNEATIHVDGAPVQTHLSDHHGLALTLGSK